jgi:hypothetical protein
MSSIGDTLEKKKWELKDIADNKYEIYNQNISIAKMDVQGKKAIIQFQNKQIEMVFNIGNKKQNSNNLKIIEKNF